MAIDIVRQEVAHVLDVFQQYLFVRLKFKDYESDEPMRSYDFAVKANKEYLVALFLQRQFLRKHYKQTSKKLHIRQLNTDYDTELVVDITAFTEYMGERFSRI